MDPIQSQQVIQEEIPRKKVNTIFFLNSVFISCLILIIILAIYMVRLRTANPNSNPSSKNEQSSKSVQVFDSGPYKYAERTSIPKNVVCAKFNSLKEALLDIVSACILDLSGQNITKIPPDISKLTHLQELYLNNNKLDSIPNEILGLKTLIILNLAKNNISNIQEGFLSNLTDLEILDLSNNKISSIDSLINTAKSIKNSGVKMPALKLRTIILDGNPINKDVAVDEYFSTLSSK